MDVGARQVHPRIQGRASLFHYLATRRVRNSRVLRFHVAAGKQPAIQSAVMHHQNPAFIGGPNHTATSDVSWSEVIARERGGRTIQQLEDEFQAFMASPSSGHEMWGQDG